MERRDVLSLRSIPSEFFKRILVLLTIKGAIKKALSRQNEAWNRTLDFCDIECDLANRRTISVQGETLYGWHIRLFLVETMTGGETHRHQCCSAIFQGDDVTRISLNDRGNANITFHKYTPPAIRSLSPESIIAVRNFNHWGATKTVTH